MANRLARETSPYLIQHAENPVDWYPWGDEARARARAEDKAILLSVGYSTCHWCHVMAHESFEDAEIARLMSEHFVCIKVDREEMPDLDSIYQQALQLQGEHGGWPLTMFLLPDGTPFFGGTYFPRSDGFGRPGFARVLTSLAEAWRRDRASVQRNAGQFRDGLRRAASWGRGQGEPRPDTVDRAAQKLLANVDRVEGGFGGAPKFPNPRSLELLLRAHRRARRRGDADAGELLSAVTLTLARMDAGGIYDHLGGGFARYATDAQWLVPHFEKMLYDNAQLLVVHAEAHQLAPSPGLVSVCDETVAWFERELRAPEGGLYTAQDADSEGVEGKYYVWTPAEVHDVVGEEAARLVERCYDVRAGGNWRDPHGHGPTGASILHVVDRPAGDGERALLDEARALLLAARARRVPPITDDKVLAGVNGLAIAGLAEAGRIFGRPHFIDGARRTAEFVLARMQDGAGRLRRTWSRRDGSARHPGTLEDHAWFADGLIALYEATGEARWLDEAYRLTDLCLRLFHAPEERTFYMTAADDPGLIQRPVSMRDGAVPSGASVCIENLVRLGDVTGEARFLEVAEQAVGAYHEAALANPHGFAGLLCAVDLLLERPAAIVLAGDDTGALERALAQVYLPNRLIARAAGAPARLARLVAGKTAVEGRAAAWVCRDFACERPETDPARLGDSLAGWPL